MYRKADGFITKSIMEVWIMISGNIKQQNDKSKVAILMCIYNGESHLEEQLDSLINQKIDNIDIWVSDDGSSDSSLKILELYQNKWSKGIFRIIEGPRKGFAINFLSLICNDKIKADYFAYCDQDDIWEKDKITRGIEFLGTHEAKPAMYCSRTSIIDELGQDLKRMSPLFQKPPSFLNAIVQSIAGGNTMLLNLKACQLMRSAGIQNIVSHDWWTYMIITGAGGSVFYDPKPSMKYRQHENNQIGNEPTYLERLKRLRMLLKGSFSDSNAMNIKSLENNIKLLNPISQKTLDNFIKTKNNACFKRLYFFSKCGCYRQTIAGNFALWIAVILGKI